jgi:hypothetical protein
MTAGGTGNTLISTGTPNAALNSYGFFKRSSTATSGTAYTMTATLGGSSSAKHIAASGDRAVLHDLDRGPLGHGHGGHGRPRAPIVTVASDFTSEGTTATDGGTPIGHGRLRLHVQLRHGWPRPSLPSASVTPPSAHGNADLVGHTRHGWGRNHRLAAFGPSPSAHTRGHVRTVSSSSEPDPDSSRRRTRSGTAGHATQAIAR